MTCAKFIAGAKFMALGPDDISVGQYISDNT